MSSLGHPKFNTDPSNLYNFTNDIGYLNNLEIQLSNCIYWKFGGVITIKFFRGGFCDGPILIYEVVL